MNNTETFQSATDAIDAYLGHRRSSRAPISISNAILAVRRSTPRCQLTDGEMANIIALHAIAANCTILFDQKERGRPN